MCVACSLAWASSRNYIEQKKNIYKLNRKIQTLYHKCHLIVVQKVRWKCGTETLCKPVSGSMLPYSVLIRPVTGSTSPESVIVCVTVVRAPAIRLWSIDMQWIGYCVYIARTRAGIAIALRWTRSAIPKSYRSIHERSIGLVGVNSIPFATILQSASTWIESLPLLLLFIDLCSFYVFHLSIIFFNQFACEFIQKSTNEFFKNVIENHEKNNVYKSIDNDKIGLFQ